MATGEDSTFEAGQPGLPVFSGSGNYGVSGSSGGRVRKPSSQGDFERGPQRTVTSKVNR